MKNNGFTLIELAIVVVVLGILITGIVGGQSIIKSAKRQSQITFMKKYETALQVYKLEFDAVPGDHDEAEDYFSNDSRVVNGNGDKRVSFGYGFRGDMVQEMRQFFVHLNASEIITDLNPSGTNKQKAVDFPENPIGNDGAMIVNYPAPFAEHYYQRPSYKNLIKGHYMWLSVISDIDSTIHNASAFVWDVSDVAFLDKKIDDGNGKTGKFLIPHFYQNSAYAMSNSGALSRLTYGITYCRNDDGEYLVNNSGGDPECMPIYRID
jgi:prepilin-type N-terminal cleavage/methylation domain-containing protein